MSRRKSTLESKFITVAAFVVVSGLVLTVGVSVYGSRTLGEQSSKEIERGLTEASQELVKKQLDDTGHAIDRLIAPTLLDLDTATDHAQGLVDQAAQLAPMFTAAAKTPGLTYESVFRAEGMMTFSKEGSAVALGVFSTSLDASRRPPPNVERRIAQTAMLDPVLASLQKNNPGILQMYYVGTREEEILRMVPWVDVPGVFAKLYPDSVGKGFWDYFFGGIVDHWQAQAAAKETFAKVSRQPVMWPPYDDAAGGGLIVTFFRPVWSADRARFDGGIGIDITLNDLVKSIADVRVGKSGFAFLIEANQNVLAVNDAGSAVLKLKSQDEAKPGLKMLTRYVGASGEPDFASLKDAQLKEGETHFFERTFGGERWVLALRKNRVFDVMRDGKVQPESWTLGVTIPSKEIYGPLLASQRVIEETSRNIIFAQVGTTLLTLIAVLGGIVVLVRKLTAPLAALTTAAQQIQQRNYDVSVPEAKTGDEIDELTTAFNAMAADAREHTKNLEGLVAQRTADLNRTLSDLWSEMDLARKIQTVLLPETAEFRGYDVAALMQPAANVGGDYYDWFKHGDAQWLLVGDVSGHGVSSGLIMMMAQTAVRATTHSLSQQGIEPKPSEVLGLVNASIRSNLKRIGRDQYMTVNALRLEEDGVRYAGLHQDLLVWRAATGTVERVETEGLWVGLLDDISPFLVDAKLSLQPRDVLLLYTDGLTEARVGGEMLGVEALVEGLRVAAPGRDSRAIIEEMLKNLGTSTFDDDVTLVAIRRAEA
ncbi:SpoIIE family protein phosphatase [Myxococcota bacterium]|nr:SpoIIE family protein phosphatase [Myxococcota bacterium]